MKKSTTIVGLALTMLAVYAILNLVSLKRDLADAMEQTSALQAEIQQAQAEGAELEENMQPEVGAVLEGKVSGVTKFGAFVNLPGDKSGLVHISEIANTFVSDVAQYVSVGQTVKVKVIGINGDKINLSIKRAEESKEAPRRRAPQQRSEQQSRPPKQPQQPSGQVAAPTEDQAFEDKLKQFMKDSDSRIADNRMYADRGRSRRRK